MKYLFFMPLVALLAYVAKAAPITTNTYVEFSQMGPSGTPVSRGAAGSANPWEMWSFDGAGILGPKSLSEMFAGSGLQITNANVADGTIGNADISPTAGIALSKLAVDPLARANHTGTQQWDTIVGAPDFLEPDPRLNMVIAGNFTDVMGFAAGINLGGRVRRTYHPITGTTMDVSKGAELYVATGNQTLTFLNGFQTGDRYELLIRAGVDPITTGFPTSFSMDLGYDVSSVFTPAGDTTLLGFLRESDRWAVSGLPVEMTGSGPFVGRDAPQLNNPNIGGVIGFADGQRQTNNPSNTRVGHNPGSNPTEPVTDVINGDWFYKPGTGFRFYQEGAWVTLNAGGPGGTGNVSSANDFAVNNAAIVSDGTGKNVKKTPVIISPTGDVSGVNNFTADVVDAGELNADSLLLTEQDGAGTETVEPYVASSHAANRRVGYVFPDTGNMTYTHPTAVMTYVGESVAQTLTNKTISGASNTLTGIPLGSAVTGTLPVANGGTGTASPGLVAGSNVTITGTWPNQTVSASSGGSPTITDLLQNPPPLYDEFVHQGSYNTTYNAVGPFGWKSTISSGASVGGNQAALGLSLGATRIETGSTGTPAAGIMSLSNAVIFNATQAWSADFAARLVTGPSIANCEMRFLFIDSITSTEPTDGVYFRYQSAVDPSWIFVCRSNNVETTIDSAVDVATSTPYTLRVTVNAAGTSAQGWINGTSIGTITTNIPGGASGRATSMGFMIYSTEAVTKYVDMDVAIMKPSFSAAR